jgi:acetylornithine deacetylase/succinyl-diaminopimelate desuccinylase-like protein
MSVDGALAWLESNDQDSIDRWMEWLRIPSVGTDPAYDGETRKAAEWCRDHLRGSGFEVDLVETAVPEKGHRGQPVVFGHSRRTRGTRARGSCSTGTTTCSPRTRSSCGTARRSSR